MTKFSLPEHPPKILHVGKFYAPYQGGIETVLKGVCEGMRGRAAVSALVANTAPRSVQEFVGGVFVERVASLGNLFSVSLCPSFPWALRRKETDFIVLHEPNPLATAAYLAARPAGQLLVWHHGDILFPRFHRLLYAPLQRRLYEKALLVIASSPQVMELSPLLKRYREKCVLVPYGVPTDRFRLTQEVEKKVAELRAVHPGPRLLFVGRLVYYKGIPRLLSAMRSLDAHLTLIGSGPMEREIRRMLVRLGLQSKAELLCQVSSTELVAYYHACDIFVLPSEEETEAFGLVQLEAMACGKPVISTDLRSGVPWVNRHGETGLVVPPKDGDRLARSIRELLADRERQQIYGQNGLRRVASRFTEQAMIEGFWKAILHASGNGSACHPFHS